MEYILNLTAMTILFAVISGFVIYITMLIMARLNFILTYCPQNHIKALMRGGDFVKFIENVKGYRLNRKGSEEYEFVKGDNKDDERDKKGFWGWLLKQLGMYWVGLPPNQVLRFRLKWLKYTKDGGTNYTIESRDEIVSSILFRTIYPVVVPQAELIGNIKVDITLLLGTNITNPWQAFFGKLPVGNFINELTAEAVAAGKEHASKYDFDGLKSEQKSGETDKGSFEKHIMSTRNEGLKNAIGHKIETVEFVKYDEDPAQKEVSDALVAKQIAKHRADAKREEAVGKRDAEKIIADGEAYHLKEVGREMKENPEAARLRTLQAIEGSNLVTPGGGGDNLLLNIPVSPKKEKED